mmetsp:Transcript_41449/g.110921  ORF Transcript_41449/g.110921 Transcript_41449/m.110921 type:complete len:257 (+) Transcript_41449:1536-2306(+)
MMADLTQSPRCGILAVLLCVTQVGHQGLHKARNVALKNIPRGTVKHAPARHDCGLPQSPVGLSNVGLNPRHNGLKDLLVDGGRNALKADSSLGGLVESVSILVLLLCGHGGQQNRNEEPMSTLDEVLALGLPVVRVHHVILDVTHNGPEIDGLAGNRICFLLNSRECHLEDGLNVQRQSHVVQLCDARKALVSILLNFFRALRASFTDHLHDVITLRVYFEVSGGELKSIVQSLDSSQLDILILHTESQHLCTTLA